MDKKDPKDPALVSVASQPLQASAPLLPLSMPALGDGNGITNSAGERSSATQQGGPEPAPDQKPELQPLPLPPSASRLPIQDLAFALRLLGGEFTTKADASRAVQAAVPEKLATQAASSDKTLASPETVIPGSNKDAGASARLSGPESLSTREMTALKSQTTPSAGSPKAPSKQSSPDEAAKGSDNSHSDAEREAAPALALKTVDAKSAAQPFAEVSQVAPSAPEPAAAPDTKPLQTNADILVPLKTNLPASAAAHDISVRLSGPDETSATVRVLDRSGDIRVSVHAADPQVANSLRSDVDQLRSHLTSRGWDAEVWKPEAAALKESGNHSTSQEQYSAGKRDGQGQNQTRQQQHDQSRKRPAWLDELENTAVKGGQ